jgi:5-methylcytosine-specific restriction endonuclease McrA
MSIRKGTSKIDASWRWLDGKRLCSSCEVHLDPSLFGKNSKYSDGLYPKCKTCRYSSEKKYRENNPDAPWVTGKGKIVGTDHRYKDGLRYCSDCKNYVDPGDFSSDASHKDGLSKRCRKCTSTQNLNYRESHVDALKKSKSKWYFKNREVILQQMREYYRENYPINPERWAKHGRNRRALKRANGNGGKVDYQLVLERSGGVCYLCDTPIEDELHFDHIIPLSRSGTHTEDNLAPTHIVCNLRKGTYLTSELTLPFGGQA